MAEKSTSLATAIVMLFNKFYKVYLETENDSPENGCESFSGEKLNIDEDKETICIYYNSIAEQLDGIGIDEKRKIEFQTELDALPSDDLKLFLENLLDFIKAYKLDAVKSFDFCKIVIENKLYEIQQQNILQTNTRIEYNPRKGVLEILIAAGYSQEKKVAEYYAQVEELQKIFNDDELINVIKNEKVIPPNQINAGTFNVKVPKARFIGNSPVLGSHNVTVKIIKNGKVIKVWREVSGNATSSEMALGIGKMRQATHTEQRVLTRFDLIDETILITGQNPPCKNCQGAMRLRTLGNNGIIIYQWREKGKTVQAIWKNGKKLKNKMEEI